MGAGHIQLEAELIMGISQTLRRWADGNTINSAHVIPKLFLFAVLACVLFVNDPRKVAVFGSIIVLLCFGSPVNFLKSPLRIIVIILTFLGILLYYVAAGEESVRVFVVPISAIRFTLLMILGILAQDAFSDRELRVLATRIFAPALIGAFAGLQRIGITHANIVDAQKVRGILPTWRPHKFREWLISWGYAYYSHMARLTDAVEYQFTLRNYASFKASILLRRDWRYGDIMGMAVVFLLLILAIVPLG